MSYDNDLRHPELTRPGLGPSLPFLQSGARQVILKAKLAPGSGPATEKTFRIHKDRAVIGSVPSADVKLGGDGVSPIHAVFEVNSPKGSEPASVTLYDLASDSGLFVNGTKVVTRTLRNGDVIQVGYHQLTFSLEIVPPGPIREKLRGEEGDAVGTEELASLLLQDSEGVEEIFDYRPAMSQTALEVVMAWEGTIIDIEHFVNEKGVSIGPLMDSDFGIPPILSSRNVELVSRSGLEFMLNLDPKMRGVLQRDGQLQTIEPRSLQAIPLRKGDAVKITLGTLDFYLSFTAAPPKLKRQRVLQNDPFYFRILGTSILMTALVLLGLSQMQVPQNVEAEKISDPVATVLYQPEKYVRRVTPPEPEKAKPVTQTSPTQTQPKVEPPKPKPEVTKIEIKPDATKPPKEVPKEMDVGKAQVDRGSKTGARNGGAFAQNEGKEGRGAKAQGKEGRRGTKSGANTQDSQRQARRPSPTGGKGLGGANSQVEDQGNIDFLKGAGSKIQNLLGGSASKLGKGGEKLQGFGAFNSVGEGGLALSGQGKGGGGDAASLGGLSDQGRGGGRVGTGMGAAGNGSGIVGGRARVVLRTGGPEESVVMGAIDADAVRAAIEAQRDQFRYCYEKELKTGIKKFSGRIGASFVIGSSGRVTQAGVESSTLGNAAIERCVLDVIRRIDFPIPRGGGVVQVTYPFKFSPAN